MPAGTTTLEGTGSAPELLLIRLTANPPTGASPFSVTVPVVIWPATTVAGLRDRVIITGGTTVIEADMRLPLGKVAVMLTGVLAATGRVVTLKVALVTPPG